MTREEAIKEVNKAFEPAFANYIITALTEGATKSDRCEDVASRTEVIDTMETVKRKDPMDFYDLLKTKYNICDIEDSIER